MNKIKFVLDQEIVSLKRLLIILGWFIINQTVPAQVNFTSSNLPIVILNTHSQVIVDDPKITADMKIIYNGEGKTNYLTGTSNVYNGKIGIEIRGHSSQMFPKKQYGIELRDTAGNSINSSLVGMPAESDWVLNASYTDKTFLRNVLAYKLGNDIGRYASRTMFCEVILNDEYVGLYILQEKVKRDKNRVDIKKIEASDTSGNDLTGGYIMKMDRIDPGDKYFNSIFSSVYPKTPKIPSPISYIHVYPNADNILPVQQNYIRNYITQFETSLSKNTYKDPFTGYYDYIDMDAAADYFLINEFVKTVDAYRLSFNMYKNRDSEGGKLIFGPIWDYDLAFGLADYGDAWLSSGWEAQINPYEGLWSTPFWIKKIFNDPILKNKLAKRWYETKDSIFNLNDILDYIDTTVSYIDQAKDRNFLRWPILGKYQWPEYYVGESYEDEVLYLKGWIIRRINWMNENLSENYSDVEWLTVDFSKESLKPSAAAKYSTSLFAQNLKNISAFEFVSPDSNISFNLLNDTVAVIINNHYEHTFKIKAKYNNEVVSISPAYQISLPTGINEKFEKGKRYNLNQNYPNPFNASTKINYSIPQKSFIILKIYNLLGKEIATLVNEEKQSGKYEVEFNGSNFTSGVYFYKMQAGSHSFVKKFILLK